MGTYSIIILDNQGKKIGELMTASCTEIMKLINKGFSVIDRLTNQQLTEASMSSMVGVSDGLINIG